MALTFREFITLNDFNCSLFEQDSAPTSGAAPEAPENPDNKTTNQYHFSSLKRQLGIDDQGLKAALQGNSMPVFQVPDYSYKWGFLVIGTCPAVVEQRSDGNYNITFQLEDKKLMEPESFIKPYEKGERPIVYQGKITDKKETITPKELQDMMAKPFAGMAAGAGAAPPMGGPPGLPGGM
jgi:hypothetical protein